MNIGQLINQIVLMFCLMLVGVLINKLKFMHSQTSSDLTNVLLYIVSPCLIINAFEQPYSGSRIKQFLLAIAGVFLLYIIEIIVAKLVFGRLKNQNLRRIAQYGSIYSNAGFMGIPLISSLFGSEGVFFAVVSLAAFNIFSWTQGVSLFKDNDNGTVEKTDWRQVLLNPNIIAIFLGILLFIFSIKIPATPNQVIKYVGSINTPLSMIVIGNSLANIKFSRDMLNKEIGLTILLRNLLFPIIGIVLLKVIGVTGIAFYTTVVMAACPVAGLVVLFTLQVDGDTAPAISLMSLSTILSLITIPLVFALGNLI
ncbi:AEC family transporter [Companilactobacillus nantensis]|uniref:Putative malate transport protein (Putative) n=1 Tax=Companilactobacillus nantensis DSM 16982 TaxID=1423774 RepID=A0A0R1WDU0_9LACO|nr:AEC family transporter [Companilactobacillus nantensis]KRM16055.1 putative malate transport protein (putative) [Companilactobacillus nantensis DSM 16982]GEO63842.1 transporter [Companilactobacillus nantensis]